MVDRGRYVDRSWRGERAGWTRAIEEVSVGIRNLVTPCDCDRRFVEDGENWILQGRDAKGES